MPSCVTYILPGYYCDWSPEDKNHKLSAHSFEQSNSTVSGNRKDHLTRPEWGGEARGEK